MITPFRPILRGRVLCRLRALSTEDRPRETFLRRYGNLLLAYGTPMLLVLGFYKYIHQLDTHPTSRLKGSTEGSKVTKSKNNP